MKKNVLIFWNKITYNPRILSPVKCEDKIDALPMNDIRTFIIRVTLYQHIDEDVASAKFNEIWHMEWQTKINDNWVWYRIEKLEDIKCTLIL